VPVVLQNRQRAVAIDRAWLGRTAAAVLAAARAGAAELSLVLVSDRRMRALNRRYRKKDRPTDVLAFPIQRASLTLTLSLQGRGKKIVPRPRFGGEGAGEGEKPPMLLGDVVISMETAKRQASEFGHSLRDEVARLLVHGVLHLLGYDHERSERDASVMARRERAILRTINCNHPLPFPPHDPLHSAEQRVPRGRVRVGGHE
jgi:rRNA maturation RNase YbeY